MFQQENQMLQQENQDLRNQVDEAMARNAA